jgi:adenylate cyclase
LSDTIIRTRGNLEQLRQFLDRLTHTANQQQHTLRTTRPAQAQQSALRDSGEMTRLLAYARTTLEDLELRVQAQATERNRLHALQQVGAAINSSLELEEVLHIVMDTIISLTNAERAMLLLMDDARRLQVQVARNMDRETIEKAESFKISRSIVRRVAQTGEAVVTMNAQEDERFSSQESIISYKLRSILCAPLKNKDEIIGVIYADNRIAAGIFGETDLDLLASFADQAAVAIENARLFRQLRNNLAEITEMKELMDNVFASIASGVITIDEADRIRLYNRAAERILGVTAVSALHQAYQGVLDTLGLSVAPLIHNVKIGGGTHNTEIDLALRRRPGTSTLNLTFSPLRDVRQETLGVAMVLDDVSEKKRLESVRRYLPPELVDQVRDLDAAQRPQRRMLSVIFADVRGFSAVSEQLDPEELIQVINGYFTQAVKAIAHYQGVTDKFMGDAVMALFNTPLNPQLDHVARAVRTAWMIQQQTAVFHATLPPERRLRFGIGVHVGEAVVGNVGSALRKDYSAIGAAVNLAKRLQEAARPDQVLISQAVYTRVQELVEVEALPLLRVKGRQAFVQTYALLGIK